MSSPFAIETENLGRIYKIRGTRRERRTLKERVALFDVNLTVPRGEFFGLLGPNGAGKTSLIKVLVTLLAPTSGRAIVAGYDVVKDPRSVRPRINMVSGGESSGYGLLTVRENLWMFGQFYGMDNKTTRSRIDELLEVVGLKDRANTKTSDLSTGLRQKMNVVRGFLTDPEVIFLDEPTLGLDVGASRDVRQFVRSWIAAKSGRTVLLTTHYMAEADELCDRVAIINEGKVLACDTPSRLKRDLRQEAIFHLEVSPLNGAHAAFNDLPGVRKVTHIERIDKSELELVLDTDDAISGVIHMLTLQKARILNLQKREPTLEDVFVDLVGMSLAEAGKKGDRSVTRDTGWRLFLRTIVARAYPRVIGQQRQMTWLFFETVLPFIAVTTYVFVYRAIGAPKDYIGFVVLGGAMTAFWVNVMWSMSAQLYWEKDNGNLALYIMAPNSLMAVLLGMALGGMFATALRAIVILILGTWIFDVSFTVSDFVALFLVFALCMTALYGLGMLFASVFLLWGRNAWQVTNMLQEPVYFLSGFYFPVKTFGFAFALMVSAIPLTLGLDAMRQLTFSSGPSVGFLPVRTELELLVVLSVVFVAAARYWLNKMERLAVQEGSLTDRRR